jgi:rhodanese-related sulfurtransferase
VPGSVHIELGSLTTRSSDVDNQPVVVMCGHCDRAMTAATLLHRAGHRDVAVLVGGADEWAKATGQRLESGG